jgi:hypothetical protein
MYSPKLKQDLVERLYALCQELEIPMTVFVNAALEQAVVSVEERLVREEREEVLARLGVQPRRARAEKETETEAAAAAIAAG